MAVDQRIQAAIAAQRFGFTPRPGILAKLAPDPRGVLIAEIERPNAGQIVDVRDVVNESFFRT